MKYSFVDKQFKYRNCYFWLVLICWTMLIVVIILFFAKQALHDYHEEAKSQARAAYFRDLAYRAWCSSHGGVYVPITEKTQPNPYLVHPERDVATTTGKKLTLVNPAWMTSEVHKLHKDKQSLQSRIISDVPINPANATDEWETKAMVRLRTGEEECSEIVDIDGTPWVRLIRPLTTDQSCLTCHEYQGYKLGDLRGGISISRPVDDLLARKYSVIRVVASGYLLIWLVGVLGILYGWHKVILYSDIRERTIKQLRKAMRDAKDANASKTQFLANISHEIRTPMTAILGFSDLLYSDNNDGGTETNIHNRHVGIIRNNARLLLDIVNDLLDMTKIESGKIQLESIPVSPIQICEDVLSLMRVRTVGKPLVLKTQYHFPLPETIQTDPSRLRQILINLVGNAIKFTAEGQVVIDLSYRREGNADCLDYRVIDTGIGISDEQIEKIFHPFTQADTSISRSFGGTGLGLFISQKFANLLGGQIKLESSPGQGSIFTLHTFVSLTDETTWVHSLDNALEDQNDSTPQMEAEIFDLSGKRILLAEDGVDNQRLFSILIKKLNAEIIIANNGAEAVEFAIKSQEEKRPFDLILMDIQMPVMDGFAAMRKLRQKGWDGRIIALTANAMESDRKRCLDSGADDYISKPVNAKEFLHKIGDAICDVSSYLR